MCLFVPGTSVINVNKMYVNTFFVPVLFMSMSQLADHHYPKSVHAQSLALPTAHLQELYCFRREAVQLYLSFINLIKLKTLRRYEGCNTTL